MTGKRRYWLLLLLLVLGLSGCGRAGGSGTSKDTKAYRIYYTNLAGTALAEKSYVPSSDRFDGILMELLEEFENCAYTDVASAMPSGVSINRYTMGVDNLQVDFNTAYLGISNVQEILLRAGLVSTLVQLPGVMKVTFTVDGQPLTDNDGREVGAMDENTFINVQGNGINSYHYVTLNLYFSNAAGDKVVKEVRNAFYSSNLIMEKVIVEQIISGPVNEKLLAVADPSVAVKSVKIVKDICVIDLDSSFNDAPNGAVEPETCLYAFVNAICDACDVEGVRFKIDGESDVRFRGKVNLDQVFTRDADIIEASGISEPLTEIFLDEDGEQTESLQTEAAAEDVQEAVIQDSGTENGETKAAAESQTQANETEASTDTRNNTVGGMGQGVGVDPALGGG